ncbi:GNAT family N-acetyltransferase [Soonwooa sp.]|uniref:GNAT family N-acetyltransferase n=1 Tax=Soonwooa sp. TaxID=1938592 RepID=UPI002611E4C4|nr:GNAT family N-acetyltransferase [Soonwooa sp.]
MYNIEIKKTDSTNPDFQSLVKLLDADLAIRDGDDHDFYHQFNGIDSLKHCLVLYKDNQAVACGAIKSYDDKTAEVKRMFVLDSERGQGFASRLLKELEVWAWDLGYDKLILETGINQPEAISLYKKLGYSIIENYGQYKDLETSICFEKTYIVK